jgi:hypothetical protein
VSDRRGQDEQCRCLFKATDHTPSRTPSVGLMLDLAIEPERRGLLVLHVRVRALQHPSRASAGTPFLMSRKEQPHRPTLPRLDAPRGPPRRRRQDASHRLLQPTFPTRAPNSDRPTPEPAACAAATASTQRIPRLCAKAQSPEPLREHGVGPPFGNPAPGEAALDGAAPASARCFTFLSS